MKFRHILGSEQYTVPNKNIPEVTLTIYQQVEKMLNDEGYTLNHELYFFNYTVIMQGENSDGELGGIILSGEAHNCIFDMENLTDDFTMTITGFSVEEEEIYFGDTEKFRDFKYLDYYVPEEADNSFNGKSCYIDPRSESSLSNDGLYSLVYQDGVLSCEEDDELIVYIYLLGDDDKFYEVTLTLDSDNRITSVTKTDNVIDITLDSADWAMKESAFNKIFIGQKVDEVI